MVDRAPFHSFLSEVRHSLTQMSGERLEALTEAIIHTRDTGGRVFCCGVGGSSAIASHFAQDLRKMCRIEAYAPTDAIGEVTARANDDGFTTIFRGALAASRLRETDVVVIFSTSGNSPSLVAAAGYARARECAVFLLVGQMSSTIEGIIGPEHVLILTSVLTKHMVTQAESLMSVLCHAIVSHPAMVPG